jgi:hypothetical protein
MSLTDWKPRKSRTLWLLAFVLAIFPFLLRTGIDSEVVLKQAITSLYRSWRFSDAMSHVKTGSPVIFERQKEKSFFEETFFHILSRDFLVRTSGDHPRIRAFFQSSSSLQMRVETRQSLDSEPRVWEGLRRYMNNGILFGVWIALLFWFFGRSYRALGAASLFFTLFWYAEWNILEIPGRVFFFIEDFGREVFFRFANQDWTAGELGRLAELAAFLWVALSFFFLKVFVSKFHRRHFLAILVLSLLIEPLFVWAGSQFGSWSQDASWWKVFAGSLAFRFVTVAHILYILLSPSQVLKIALVENQPSPKRTRSMPGALLMGPLVFLGCGGWEWLHSILTPSSGDSLLQLKVFFVGFVLSFVVSSRIFAMWLGVTVISLILPPTQGHWLAASYVGVVLDGLILGWWVSPFKGPGFMLGGFASQEDSQKRFFVVSLLGWLCGTVFSAVGAPLPICWVAVVLGVWAYAQLTGPLAQQKQLEIGEVG